LERRLGELEPVAYYEGAVLYRCYSMRGIGGEIGGEATIHFLDLDYSLKNFT
jgi:hypothetical protein